MKNEKEGYITVYLALMLGVMMSFVFTMVEAVRIQTIRTQTEGVMDISLFSVFGEFHRELLEQYDLFFIDTTYGEGAADIKRSEEHLQYYFNKNVKENEAASLLGFRDLTDLSCDNVNFEAYMRANDKEGKVLKNQITEYMQEKKGIHLLESGIKNLLNMEKSGEFSRDVEGEWEAANETVREIVEERKKDYIDEETGETVEVDMDNPSDEIKQTSYEGILGLAMPSEKKISTAKVNLKNYFSERKKLTGKGSLKERSDLLDAATEEILLQEYLFEKCSFFHQTKDKSLLKYQIEYLLKGNEEDTKNLEEVIKDILHIRQIINITYLFSDGEKIEEANNLAWIISMILFTPELQEAVKISILYAWSYVESVKDIRILLDGNKVPLIKNKDSWNTPLHRLLMFKSDLGNYTPAKDGMAYQDYLSFFLYLKTEKEIMYRFMDICEMDIRLTKGNSYFQMDGCIESVKATANVSSGYGHGFRITRTYAYR